MTTAVEAMKLGAATGDDKLAAAKLLGIGERTLWTKLKKHAI